MMKRILVINFTRMGDIVQTSPLITGMRQKWGHTEIDLLVMRGFSAIAELIPGVARVLQWDQDESVSSIVRGDSLADIYRYHRDFATGLCEVNYDLIINVTHSNESAILLRLLRGSDKRGILLDDLGRKLTAHPWIDYFFNVTANRGFNDFNLADIYRRIGDLNSGEGGRLKLQPPADAIARASCLLSDLPADRSFRVALQPGANRENRRWPAARYAELARRLYTEYDAAPLLIGSQGERQLTEQICELAAVPLLNLAGATTVPQLVALLGQCDLLISNDTGSMHIAAAMDTPTVALFMATALPHETCVYSEQTIVLQPTLECAPCSHQVVCPHQRCRQEIQVETVLQAIAYSRGETVDFTGISGVRVLQPRFNRDGMLQLRRLSRERLRAEHLVTAAYRLLWKTLLDDTPTDNNAEAHCREQLASALPEQLEILQDFVLPQLPSETAELSKVLDNYRQTLGRVEQLGRRGFAAATTLDRSSDPELLLQAVSEITSLDNRLFQLEMQHQFIRPLCVLYRFNRENMSSDDIDYLAHAGKAMYHTLEVRARLLAWSLLVLQQGLLQPEISCELVGELMDA
ncbi:glycosyltransferase family 9 protein [bacterium]|nr:glycosyltransferase family 9 protein [bacterium]